MEKKKKKGILYLFTLSVLLLFSVSTSCKDEESSPIPVQKIEFSTSTLTLNIGETAKVEATIYPFDATEKRLQWNSSDSEVAKVDSEGCVTAYGDGTATITAIPFDGDCIAKCNVIVLPDEILVEKITLSNESLTMSVNDEFELKVEIYPSDATNKNLIWKSNNTSVATVENGIVKAINEGNAIIYVSTEDGKHTLSCAILVTNSKLSWGICGTFNNWGESGEDIPMLDNIYENYYVARNVNLKSYEVDAFAFRYCNSWELHKGADEKYEYFTIGTKYYTATYDDGVSPIFVMKQGTYDIFLAKTLDYFYIMLEGEKPNDGNIISISVTGVSLDKNEISLVEGESTQLICTITPSNATNKDVLWYSSNISVARVDEGGKVTAVKNGNARITATSKDGGKTAFCDITVTSNGEDIKVQYIELDESSLSLYEGDEYKLSVIITPSNATNKEVSWSSSNISVATVDSEGNVVAVKNGNARITATSKDGGKFAICDVLVNKKGGIDPSTFDFQPSGTEGGYDYVDLGLSVKWATHNIGTNDIEGFGEYYAWGEITPYNFELTYINYGWSFAPCSPDAILASIYDTATKTWGDSWRMPTADEMKELINGCNWTWVNNFNNTSTSGYVATSKKNGKSIFLPATKFMSSTSYEPKEKDAIYWTSSTHSVAGKLNFQAGTTAECLRFVTTEGMVAPVEMNTWAMGNGATIRPVIGTPNDYFPDPEDLTVDYAETQRQGISVSGGIDGYTYVDLGMPSRTLWATYNVGATMPTEYGDYFAWGETAPKEYYIDETYVFFKGFSDGKNPRTQLSKYVWEKEYGTPDAKFKLDNEDDAAYVNWSSNWCMPTVEQVTELAEYCDFWRKDIVVNGKKIVGYMGESKLNGNRIYFPAAGWEYSSVPNTFLSMNYWTSEISRKISTWASLMQYREVTGLLECHDGTARWEGLSVRPVVKNK